jgi:hypothetical protein
MDKQRQLHPIFPISSSILALIATMLHINISGVFLFYVDKDNRFSRSGSESAFEFVRIDRLFVRFFGGEIERGKFF